jgi:hypothetical protein
MPAHSKPLNSPRDANFLLRVSELSDIVAESVPFLACKHRALATSGNRFRSLKGRRGGSCRLVEACLKGTCPCGQAVTAPLSLKLKSARLSPPPGSFPAPGRSVQSPPPRLRRLWQRGAPVAGVVARSRFLKLENIGPKIVQQLSADGAGENAAEVEDASPCEGSGVGGHGR